VRRDAFVFDAGPEVASQRHHARALNFEDQSIFSYSSPNKNWWGNR
jgi:hypothetical protein